MASNPPEGCQRVIPYLLYEDAAAALDFLCTAFGFTERMRFESPDGQMWHAEAAYQDNVVMLASAAAAGDSKSVKELGARHSFVMCYVDDVDAHHAHAKAHGARITGELADKEYGDRMYAAEDPEGHRWFFATHMKDVDLSAMDPAADPDGS